MSARIITNAAVGAANYENEVESKNIGKKGDYNMNFSNMYNTSKPVIQAGSSVDIDGQIYVFDINENISGAIGSGAWYVIISTAGNASFINTVPLDYDNAKNGYYTAGGSRYVLGFDGTGSIYSDKYNIEKSYFDTPVIMKKNLSIGGALTIAGNITQTAGVTTLKTTTVNAGVSASIPVLGVKNGGFILMGDATSYGFQMGVDSTGDTWMQCQRFAGATAYNLLLQPAGGRVLSTGAIDNGIDAHQVLGSIYASSDVKAGNRVYIGDATGHRAFMSTDILELGQNRLVDGAVRMDFTTDSVLYTDHTFRLNRDAGSNGILEIIQRGTGEFQLKSNENGAIVLKGSGSVYADFNTTAIELKKDTSITGFLNTSSYGLFGGAIYDGINMLNANGNGLFSGTLSAQSYDTVGGTISLPTLYAGMTPILPDIDDEVQVCGTCYFSGALYNFVRARRDSSTSISLSITNGNSVLSIGLTASSPSSLDQCFLHTIFKL